MADLTLAIPAAFADRIGPSVDPEHKLGRALDALGPVAGRDVVLVGGGSRWATTLADLGARVSEAPGSPASLGVETGSADVIVGAYSVYRGVDPAEQAEADRALRPEGRLLVVHDYGRDDVSLLRAADLPEYTSWGRREGPYLRAGFRVRVVHCWWRFDSVDHAAALLSDGFGATGAELAAGLRRPRLSYNVAIFHRSKGVA